MSGCKDSVQKLIKYLVLKRVHTKVGFSIVSAAEPHTAYAVIVVDSRLGFQPNTTKRSFGRFTPSG